MPILKPTEKQWAERLDQIVKLALIIKEHGWKLIDRDKYGTRRDGFPRSSVPESHGAGGDPADPTADAATDDGQRADIVRTARRELEALVANALGNLRGAESQMIRGLNIPPEKPATDDNPGCVVCGRWGVWSVVYRAGRCTACWWYRYRHDGTDRPSDLCRDERVTGVPAIQEHPVRDATTAAYWAALERRKAS